MAPPLGTTSGSGSGARPSSYRSQSVSKAHASQQQQYSNYPNHSSNNATSSRRAASTSRGGGGTLLPLQLQQQQQPYDAAYHPPHRSYPGPPEPTTSTATRGLRRRPPTDIPATIVQYHTNKNDTNNDTSDNNNNNNHPERSSSSGGGGGAAVGTPLPSFMNSKKNGTAQNTRVRSSLPDPQQQHGTNLTGKQAAQDRSSATAYHRSVSAPRPQAMTPTTTHPHSSPHPYSPTKQKKSSPEEQRASAYLRKAEDNIHGLMQELEDLRFLEEIDLQDTPPQTPPSLPDHQKQLQLRSQSVPRAVSAMPHAKHSNHNTTPNAPIYRSSSLDKDAIPSLVRARSPPGSSKHQHHLSSSKNGRLPPPPPVVEPEKPPIVSMVQILSPRRISKMDRLALELETQTLCRTVDVVNQEKSQLEKAVKMYELTLQDHEHQERQMKEQLDKNVRSVRHQLQQVKHELSSVRTQVASEYDERLTENLHKLQRTQQAADQYQRERDELQQSYQDLLRESEEQQRLNKAEETRRRKSQQAKEVELEQVADLADDLREQLEAEQVVVQKMGLQLEQEIATRDESLANFQDALSEQTKTVKATVRTLEQEFQTRLSEKEDELMRERDNLRQCEQLLRSAQDAKNEEYEVRLSLLQEQLSLHRDKSAQADRDRADMAETIQEKTKLIEQYQKQSVDQDDLISDMTTRLDSVHTEYRSKFGELKEVYEAKEKRRLEEMVQTQAKEVDEYERRLSALQEQLLHQNDRHLAEITQKNIDMDVNRESHAVIRKELEVDRDQILTVMEEKLAKLQSDYQVANSERQRWRAELDSLPTREETLQLQQERDAQEKEKANEILQLRQQTERLTMDALSKDSKVQELTTKLRETKQIHANDLSLLKGKHTSSLKQREEKSDVLAKVLQSTETKLLNELKLKDSKIAEMELSMQSKLGELQVELKRVNTETEGKRRLFDESEIQLRADLSILEGKRRASSAALQQKSEELEDLQEKVSLLTNETITGAESHRRELREIQSKLSSLQNTLASERSEFNMKLDARQKESERQADLIRKLESVIAVAATKEGVLDQRIKDLEIACRDAKAELISEHTRHESTEDQTRADMARLQGKYLASEASLKEKREAIGELEDKLRGMADHSSSTNNELQKEVDQLRTEVHKLNDSVDTHRAELFEKEGLLKQQKAKARLHFEEIAELQTTLAEKVLIEEDRGRNIHDLQVSLDCANREMASERTSHESTILRLQQQIVSAEASLADENKFVAERNEVISKLQEQLQTITDKSSSSLKSLQEKIHEQERDLLIANEQLQVEMRNVEEKSAIICDLNQNQETIRAKLSQMEELEGTVSITIQNHNVAREEAASLQAMYDSSALQLESEQKRRREVETQMQKAVSELKNKLQECMSVLDDKENTIKYLEASLLRTRGDLSVTIAQHENDLTTTKRDLAMSGDLLQNERSALNTKIEALNETLRQKLSRMDSLENTIADLRNALTLSEDDKAKQSFELNSVKTGQLRDLHEKLDSERVTNEELKRKLADMESDLTTKDNQLQRLPELQAQMKQLIDGREELQSHFVRVEAELERKDTQIGLTTDRMVASTTELQALLAESKADQDKLETKIREIESELCSQRAKATQKHEALHLKLDELEKENAMLVCRQSMASEQFSSDAMAKVNELLKEKKILETKIRVLDEDREEREARIMESDERYSNHTLEFHMKVEELTRAKISLVSRVSRVEADLEHKEELLRATSDQLSDDLSAIQIKLNERAKENEELVRKLEHAESKLVNVENAKELQAKLDIESKEKRALVSKIGDVGAELERKEKQIKDIVDRYTRDIAELEYKLDDERRSNAVRQKDVDKEMRGDSSSSAIAVAKLAKEQVEKAFVAQQRETATLKVELKSLKSSKSVSSDERLSMLTNTNDELKRELDATKVSAAEREKYLEEQLVQFMGFSGDASTDMTELEEKLLTVEQSRADLEDRLKKANGERKEVMNALGDLIGEVQSREDEIEALALILKKRDEELEHAKLIATKALASAQDLKSRCRGLEENRQTDMSDKLSELNSSVDFLSKKNNSLERKTAKMEKALQDKELECSDLRNQRNRSNTNKSRHFSNEEEKKLDDDSFQAIDNAFPTFETATASPTTHGSSLVLNDTMSTQSEEIQGGATGWLHDFGSHTGSTDSDDDASSFAGSRSKSTSQQSRKSIERDAMRKYVRSRYMKSKGSL